MLVHNTLRFNIIYITRDEPYPHMYENADFSPETIKGSIKEGEVFITISCCFYDVLRFLVYAHN